MHDAQTILDIHTHRAAPVPEAVVCATPQSFDPVPGQLYSVGIHPWDTTSGITEGDWELLERAARHPQTAAIGECGIDTLKGGPLFRQMLVFKRHIQLSEELGKPLVIHDVKAHDIITGLRRDLKPSQNWVVHGFRGKPTVAAMLLDAGLWLSFGPQFNPDSLRALPSDRILAETDESADSIQTVIDRLAHARPDVSAALIAANSSRFLHNTLSD